MDVETEKVIELLFPNGLPKLWQDSADFYQYLSKVGRYDVDRLNKEPDHLIDERGMVQQSTQDLFFSNYKIFISTAENSREIHKEFNQTETKLNKLIEKIPEFINKCKSFCNTSKDINIYRRLNSLTLSKNTELLEILELPQLMEMCLRSNHYNEALELFQYARYLGAKHGEIPIIANIVNEIQNSWSLMVHQIIDSLKDDLALPKCLQLIGLLRSMESFTESELRIKFIQARDSWVQALFESISTDDSNIHLTKTIELSRIHLFNIITQYKAIFNDDDHLVLGRDHLINDSAILYQWLEEKVSQFLTTLEQDLPNITSIDSILGQCTYFVLSFGRVGADFTGRMSDIFIKVIKDKFENSVIKVTKSFEKDITNFTLVHKLQKREAKIESIINSENPPDYLLDYYPLAEYCNGLIAAFNEIRLNSPVALAQSFTKILQNSLYSVSKAMFFYYKKRQTIFTPSDRVYMVKFTECYSEQLIPYIQYCIRALFPVNQVALHLGSTVSQIQKEEITSLNKNYIIQPLKSLLPIKNIDIDVYLPQLNAPKHSEPSTDQQNSESQENVYKLNLCSTSEGSLEKKEFQNTRNQINVQNLVDNENLTDNVDSKEFFIGDENKENN